MYLVVLSVKNKVHLNKQRRFRRWVEMKNPAVNGVLKKCP